MNTINITGRITEEPELKNTQSGVAVCSYTLAVKRPKVKDTTDFISVVSWRQGAEYLCNYAHKGDMVAVTGALTSRKWQDKDGNNRTTFEVVTDAVEIVSNAQNRASAGQATTYTAKPQNAANYANTSTQYDAVDGIVDDLDLPF